MRVRRRRVRTAVVPGRAALGVPGRVARTVAPAVAGRSSRRGGTTTPGAVTGRGTTGLVATGLVVTGLVVTDRATSAGRARTGRVRETAGRLVPDPRTVRARTVRAPAAPAGPVRPQGGVPECAGPGRTARRVRGRATDVTRVARRQSAVPRAACVVLRAVRRRAGRDAASLGATPVRSTADRAARHVGTSGPVRDGMTAGPVPQAAGVARRVGAVVGTVRGAGRPGRSVVGTARGAGCPGRSVLGTVRGAVRTAPAAPAVRHRRRIRAAREARAVAPGRPDRRAGGSPVRPGGPATRVRTATPVVPSARASVLPVVGVRPTTVGVLPVVAVGRSRTGAASVVVPRDRSVRVAGRSVTVDVLPVVAAPTAAGAGRRVRVVRSVMRVARSAMVCGRVPVVAARSATVPVPPVVGGPSVTAPGPIAVGGRSAAAVRVVRGDRARRPGTTTARPASRIRRCPTT